MLATPITISFRSSSRSARRAVALIACAALMASAGCGGKKAQQAQAARADLPASTPMVHGSDNGMEMMCWGSTARSRALAELLAPYLDESVGLDARTRSLWQSNGFRLVCVPIDRLDAIRQLLPQSGGVQRQWLGQVSLWTDVLQGTPWHDLQPVEMDNGRLNLGPGKLRVLLRCWTIPVPASDAGDTTHAAMRAEFLLQHQEPPRVDPDSIYTRPTTVTDPLDEGLIFKRLAASITLPPDRALLIIPESPQLDWRALAQIPADQSPPEEPSLAETRVTPPQELPEGASGVGQVFRQRSARRDKDKEDTTAMKLEIPGPVDTSVNFSRTLGELLLTPSRVRLESSVADRPFIRSILVLVPRIPERFSFDRAVQPPNSQR